MRALQRAEASPPPNAGVSGTTQWRSIQAATPLSQSVCVTLMGFRTTAYPQPELLVDQQLLEQALHAGGSRRLSRGYGQAEGRDAARAGVF